MSFNLAAGAVPRGSRWFGMLLVVLGGLGFALPAAAGGVVNASSFTGTAIKGVDPVAEGQAGRGQERVLARLDGRHLVLRQRRKPRPVRRNVDKYAPQYGGYCAWAVSQGYTAKIDPTAWKIVDDKLYLNYSKDVQAQWSQDIPGNIAKGNSQLAEDPRRPHRVIER